MVFIQKVSFDIRAKRYQLETLFRSLGMGNQDHLVARCCLVQDPAAMQQVLKISVVFSLE